MIAVLIDELNRINNEAEEAVRSGYVHIILTDKLLI